MIPLSLLLALLIRSRVVDPLVISKNNGLLIYIVKFLEITKVISSKVHRWWVSEVIIYWIVAQSVVADDC